MIHRNYQDKNILPVLIYSSICRIYNDDSIGAGAGSRLI